jgi:cytosine/adenosine deaminase-related metal-dependent hydrolase
MLLRRLAVLGSVASLSLALVGCPRNPTDPPDSGVPVGDTGPRPDGGDAGPQPDTGPRPDGGMPQPHVTICPGDSLPALASGVCETTAGDMGLLITADVLAPGEVFRGGQVLVDATGTIACVGCDCSTSAGAATATRVVCPDGVVSPGLINAHEHLSFEGNPYTRTAERYEHRHDWREGARGHHRIGSMMATRESTMWGELRMVLGGATSVNGSGGQAGFLRNLDRATMEGLGQDAVDYNTFPLGDSSGTVSSSGCDAYSTSRTTAADIAGDVAFTPHIAEGIDLNARNEFLCQREGAFDLIADPTAMIHGVGLLPIDMQEVAGDGAMLVWSPRSNVTLYGETARVTEYDRLGVPIALGTDWVFTGSMNMLRELTCADELNATYLGNYFTDEALVRMATYNSAVATGTDDVIGSIAVGRVADLAIFDAAMHVDHRAVIDAEAGDVALVLRGGVPLYGEAAVVASIRDGATCETLDVCGEMRRVCVMREVGMTLAALTTANASSYPLFFCGTPDNEPSCRPERDAMTPLPSPSVMGSTVYSGLTTATDMDGDAIEDAADNCPTVFNPIRPLDMGMQANSDGDADGDACDPCPLDAATTTCATIDPDDRDHDMISDTIDNCVGVANMDQLDADMDGHGDVCDACPMQANPGAAACTSTIYDVKDGTVAVGSRVVVNGIVTAVGTTGFYLQVEESDADYAGPDHSGVFVYTGGAPTVMRGQRASADGTVVDFHGQLQIGMGTVVGGATGTIPTPVVVEPAEIATGGARASALEGVLVRVDTVTVVDAAPAPAGGEMAPTDEFEIDSMLRVNDGLFRLTPFPVMGESFTSITGVVAFHRDNSKLNPRDADDVVAGTPRLSALTPALSFVRVGSAAGPTFPTPLTVQLTRAVSVDTVVLVTAGVGVTVGSVTVMAGSSSAVIPVTPVLASATPVTLTATLGADIAMAQVRVLGASEGPSTFTLSPDTATIRTGGTTTFTVALDLPALAGGQSIALSETTGGTLPTTVVVPADQLSATFDFVAGATDATGTLTATALATMHTASLTITAGPMGHLVINEIDYDQAGTDTAEYIEIYNPTGATISLTGIALSFVNGNAAGDPEYTRVSLAPAVDLPAGAYLVVASATTLATFVADREVVLTGTSNLIQNGGAPEGDGVALIDTTAPAHVIDALSYTASITAATIPGFTGGVNLVEGTATAVLDSNTVVRSICRIPNGDDTDDAATDWAMTMMITPGAANVADM